MSGSTAAPAGPLPDVMAAAVYQSPGVVTVEERPVPRPGPDQVVVRVHSCGICGSDIHQMRDGWGLTAGVVGGHEWSGTIAAVGDDGDPVVGGRAGGRRLLAQVRHAAGAAARASPRSARTATP